jgi:hypothetical protein
MIHIGSRGLLGYLFTHHSISLTKKRSTQNIQLEAKHRTDCGLSWASFLHCLYSICWLPQPSSLPSVLPYLFLSAYCMLFLLCLSAQSTYILTSAFRCCLSCDLCFHGLQADLNKFRTSSTFQKHSLSSKSIWAWFKEYPTLSLPLLPLFLPHKMIQFWHQISKIEMSLKAKPLGNWTQHEEVTDLFQW